MRKPQPRELHSLCSNILFALPHIRGEIVVFAEDDDWLAPTYLARVSEAAAEAELVGNAPAIYYHLGEPSLRRLKNHRHCSLGQTCIRKGVLPLLERIARRGNPFIDLALWREWTGTQKIIENDGPLHVSVKGLPGEAGIGSGHQPGGEKDDEQLSMLAELIGEDVQWYREIQPQAAEALARVGGETKLTLGQRPSLDKDLNDAAKLQRGYDPIEGQPLPLTWGNCYPFFFSREGATLHLTDTARGSSAFLIANGPSFCHVPKEPLRKVWTMTLNNGLHSFRSNANCSVDDPSRFSLSQWIDPTVQKFVPATHFESPLWDNRRLLVDGAWQQRWQASDLKVGDCPNVIGFRRNERFQASQFLHEDTINWGSHEDFGGGRSVMLPAIRILFLLGFRQVYLLGVDFEMKPEKPYHFSEDRPPEAISGNMETYERLEEWFTELQPHFLREGFVVHNCNPKSQLTAFPYLPFEEAIARATAPIGDYSFERTEGMYRPLADKMKAAED